MTDCRIRWLRCLLLGSLTTLLLLVSSTICVPVGLGQLPSLTPPGGIQALPIGVERRGILEAIAVRLDGKELFRIASPTVFNRNEPGNQIPVEVRGRQIEANLEQLIMPEGTEADVIDPDTLRVVIETVNGQPVLFVKDANLAEPRVLLTVTDTDAQYHATTNERLANRWRDILEQELRKALELRRPEAFQQQVVTVAKVMVLTTLLTLALGATWTFLGRRKHYLEQRQATASPAIATELATTDVSAVSDLESSAIAEEQWLFQGLRQHFSLQRRLQTIQFLRWFLFWAIALIWVAGLAYSLNTFPQTRQFARKIVTIPVVVLFTWFLTGFANRLTDLATDRFIQSREQEQSLTPANLQRITTIARVIKGLKMVLLYTISMLWLLQWSNLASGAVLTLGAILALAISFAAQNLVKDFVNGFLILIEDQFRIGDMIKVGTVTGLNDITGLVENLNLRLTQLRSPEGNLITIPNSTIAQVENMSRTWARADFRIQVAYDTDVDRALAIVRETIEHMAKEAEWAPWILNPQELLGVEQLNHTGIEIRLWIRTAPLKQWDVARELRRRLKIAFDQDNIHIGIPQQIWRQNGYHNLTSG